MTDAGVMRAARLDKTGPPENLRVVDAPIPEIGPDEVLIRVELAGLIYGDAEARRGTYFSETKLPWFPGREAGGYIEAVGANVHQWARGDRIMALVLSGGCCAEYVRASTKPQTLSNGYKIPPADILHLPEKVSFAQGLVYLVNFRLAHLLFHGSSKVPAGATVLIHGASGGMGAMMTQLAHAHGCTVIGTCRKQEEAAFCRSIGADHMIIVSEAQYVAEVLKLTSGKGVDFIFNGVGGDSLNTDVDAIAPFGEIQAYGYVAGKKPFDVFRAAKCVALKTFSADDFFPTPMFPAATKAMYDWFENGPLLAADPVLPLEDIVEANRRLDSGDVIGKIAIKPARA